jgi:DNA polymerase I-like protein with 3'-5' exonuclease and polymerase domains
VSATEIPVAPYVVTPYNQTLLHQFVVRAEAAGAFAFDVETLGEHRGRPQVNDVRWLALATDGMTLVVPLGHPNGNYIAVKGRKKKNPETGKFDVFPPVWSAPPLQLCADEVFHHLCRLFASRSLIKIAHNASFDLLSVRKYLAFTPPPPYADTMVAAQLLDENRLKGLKNLVIARYGVRYDKEDVGKCIEKHPFWKVARYAWLDVRFTWLLWRHFMPLLREDERLFNVWELEMGTLEAVCEMGEEGACVDVPAMREFRDELAMQLPSIEARVYKAAGTVFNLGSVPQKQAVLYGPNGVGLKPVNLTKGGKAKRKAGMDLDYTDYSTDDEALKRYAGHPLVEAILDYQEVTKIKGTYLDAYLGTDDKASIVFDGRVYSKFNQVGAVTGRFSSSEPNLQNVPSRGQHGKRMRSFYIAPPGHALLVADYGQIEKRILAHYCRYGKLYEGFMNGIDAHTTTACALFHVAPADVTPFMRNNIAKSLGFAVDYGAEEERVATMAGIPVKEARAFLAQHEREFPEIYDFKDRLLKEAMKRPVPHIRTLLGRYRRLPDLRSPIFWRREAAKRQLLNSVCQGGNADLTKLAMVRLVRERPADLRLRLILTVHDELIATVPEDQIEAGAAHMKWAMTGPGIQELLRVPIITDVKVCNRWSEGKD